MFIADLIVLTVLFTLAWALISAVLAALLAAVEKIAPVRWTYELHRIPQLLMALLYSAAVVAFVQFYVSQSGRSSGIMYAAGGLVAVYIILGQQAYAKSKGLSLSADLLPPELLANIAGARQGLVWGLLAYLALYNFADLTRTPGLHWFAGVAYRIGQSIGLVGVFGLLAIVVVLNAVRLRVARVSLD